MSTIVAPAPRPAPAPAVCNPVPETPRSERLVFLDALRGLAALLVATHHINRFGPLWEPASQTIPAPIAAVMDNGRIGVRIFFVISGFVIAYSVRNARVTPGYLGNFALRRSIRLEPPYWCAILIVLALNALAKWIAMAPPMPDPSWLQLLTHVFYLQDVLGFDNISVGFWTLCIEFQFYLLFVIMLGVAQRLPRGARNTELPTAPLSLAIIFLPLALLSLFDYNLNERTEMWISHYFCMFFLGALVCWTLIGQMPRFVLWAYLACVAIRLELAWDNYVTVAFATGIAIYATGRARHLSDWLNRRWLQYLGRISYSLYLIHFPVSHMVLNLGHRLTGDSSWAAVMWMLVALAASIAAAHVLYTFVEAPTVRLSRRLITRAA